MISPASLTYVADILEEAVGASSDATLLLEYVIINFDSVVEQENYCSTLLD